MAEDIQEIFRVSERRVCRLLKLDIKTKRYHLKKKGDDETLKQRLGELATQWRRLGYRRLHILLAREGIQINHKRVFRLYKEAGLAIRKRRKKVRSEMEYINAEF